ncbi:hypothetical protein [Vibrio alfacsensis]|uniref:hypothetical protein n=1 Tax=Vibrio alfacsensis TaxID=1074311 RepID=UPI0040693F60
MKKLILAAIVATMAGCATAPIPTSDAYSVAVVGHGEYQIVIKRDSGLIGSACSVSIFVNGSRIGKLDQGEKITHYGDESNVIVAAKQEGFFCESDIPEAIAMFKDKKATLRVAISANKGLHISNTSF